MAQRFHDIWGPGSNVEQRVVRDFNELARRVEACRQLGLKIVLTSGTFDLFHVGHSQYLEQARQHGDVLIVGVDNDEKVRRKKGPKRPIVHEDERMKILCHSRHVDLVVYKAADDERWRTIKTVRPNVLIATAQTYTPEELEQLKEYCGEVVVLEYQAVASTTARIRVMILQTVNEIRERVRTTFADIDQFLEHLAGGE